MRFSTPARHLRSESTRAAEEGLKNYLLACNPAMRLSALVPLLERWRDCWPANSTSHLIAQFLLTLITSDTRPNADCCFLLLMNCVYNQAHQIQLRHHFCNVHRSGRHFAFVENDLAHDVYNLRREVAQLLEWRANLLPPDVPNRGRGNGGAD